MDNSTKRALLQFLYTHVTPHRQQRIESVIGNRTRHLTVVTEDTFQPHNASAVLRSCESFGVQDVHIVEQRNTFQPNEGVAVGAEKWLTLNYYPRMQDCFLTLKQRGYRLIATDLNERSVTLDQLDVKQPTALIFGNEEKGISDFVRDNADGTVYIPMYGFTQSFNISVSVALCIQSFINRLHHTDLDWQLSEEEQLDVRLAWLSQTLGEQHFQELCRRFNDQSQ